MSAVQACAITGTSPFASAFVHQAMVGLDGRKMSKSRGNLVLVSTLRNCGVDPMAIRLAVLAHHYRTPWEWNGEILLFAQDRLATWRAGLSGNGGPPAGSTISRIRECLAHDLDAPGALAAVDEWVAQSLAGGGNEIGSPGVVSRALDALLGIRL
jgi:L-cysteine:1D-myo-inositol 2-amino-2-deoxy-alpha-D-glucopyranoside ligase